MWATLVAAVALSACRRDARDEKPPPSSRSAVLEHGGIYPVVLPFGWRLIDAKGQPEEIPRLPNTAFSRILGAGALLATETGPPGRAESMMFASLHRAAPITREQLESYASSQLASLRLESPDAAITETRLFTYGARGDQAAKLAISRVGRDATFTHVHYLLPDARREMWRLTYSIRTSELAQWREMLADVEHSATSSAAGAH